MPINILRNTNDRRKGKEEKKRKEKEEIALRNLLSNQSTIHGWVQQKHRILPLSDTSLIRLVSSSHIET